MFLKLEISLKKGGRTTMTRKWNSSRIFILVSLWLGVSCLIFADVRLPAVISDHMVIQQDKPVSVWGWANRNEQVTVRLGSQTQQVRAGADSRWQMTFAPLKAGNAPLEMSIRGEKGPDVVVRDILIGEVWVGSGQSNMEWPLSAIASPIPEILRADHPGIRLFQVPKRTADRPKDDVEAKWTLCTPETVRPFSAVAYYFGLELHEKLGVPVGLIESAWGGTAIEPWTPPAGFIAVPEIKPLLDKQLAKYEEYRQGWKKSIPVAETWIGEAKKALATNTVLPPEPGLDEFPTNPFDSPQAPTTLYNGMIHALTPFAIRGAIWYQGESNRNDCLLYEKKMEALIRGWREVWKLGDFPFYYVQLAPFNYGYGQEEPLQSIPDFLRLPFIWEAQTNILRLPNTGMAVITDITDLNDIHPRNKKDVGHRLALWARAMTYGEKGLVPSGPLYKSMSVDGEKVRIAFDFVGGGLISNDGQPLRWFEIAGEDHIFYKAAAEIAGETVVVQSAQVKSPKAVRFGWHQLAIPNLANKEGLPASLFRTDNW
jgi:sialate O-acetylesterase